MVSRAPLSLGSKKHRPQRSQVCIRAEEATDSVVVEVVYIFSQYESSRTDAASNVQKKYHVAIRKFLELLLSANMLSRISLPRPGDRLLRQLESRSVLQTSRCFAGFVRVRWCCVWEGGRGGGGRGEGRRERGLPSRVYHLARGMGGEGGRRGKTRIIHKFVVRKLTEDVCFFVWVCSFSGGPGGGGLLNMSISCVLKL